MKKQLIRIAPLQTAKVLAVLYFLFSIPFVLVMAIAFAFAPGPHKPIGFLIAMPIVYLIVSFVMGLISAWLYNVVAGWIGGIEFTTAEQSEA